MARKVTSDFENNLIKSAVIRLYESQRRFKDLEKAYKDERKILQDCIRTYMSKHNFSSFNFVATSGCFANDNKKLNIVEVLPKEIEFNIPELEKRLEKPILSEIIVKEYKIVDMKGLVGYLKTCNVDPKIFKSFIQVSKEVDKKKMDQLADLGKLSQEQLSGCYEVKQKEGYVRIHVMEDA